MLTFLAGMACGVLLMLAAIAWVTRTPENDYLTPAQHIDRARKLKAAHMRDEIEYLWPASKDFAEAFDPKLADTPPEASRSAP